MWHGSLPKWRPKETGKFVHFYTKSDEEVDSFREMWLRTYGYDPMAIGVTWQGLFVQVLLGVSVFKDEDVHLF